tara:strand:- start:384 stop:767 length:384 start_codon:yes stop_codon:yes gene_type:complete
MNEFYEHPLVMEIIRDYRSISMAINSNQSRIKTNLKKFESIFGQYKKYLKDLEEFKDIFVFIHKEDIFLTNFNRINNGLLQIEFLEKIIEEIVDENIKRNNDLESTMIDSKYFLSQKRKFEDDLELS